MNVGSLFVDLVDRIFIVRRGSGKGPLYRFEIAIRMALMIISCIAFQWRLSMETWIWMAN